VLAVHDLTRYLDPSVQASSSSFTTPGPSARTRLTFSIVCLIAQLDPSQTKRHIAQHHTHAMVSLNTKPKLVSFLTFTYHHTTQGYISTIYSQNQDKNSIQQPSITSVVSRSGYITGKRVFLLWLQLPSFVKKSRFRSRKLHALTWTSFLFSLMKGLQNRICVERRIKNREIDENRGKEKKMRV
jgi:hypothetical protein